MVEVALFASFFSLCAEYHLCSHSSPNSEVCILVFRFCVTMVDITKDPFSMLVSYF